jgi:hypothetical protein
VEGNDEDRPADLARIGSDHPELEQCPGCLEWVPLDQFCELTVGLDLDAPEPHCARCRKHGRPPPPKFLSLTQRHLTAIDAIMAAPTLAQGLTRAAEATGYSRAHLVHLAAGRRTPEFRRFFQLKLEAAGADINKVVKVKVDALDADEYKWNPKEEKFDDFPDHRTRLRASQDVTKLLEMEPPKSDGISVGVAIKFETNLGSGETHDPPNVLRAKPIVEVTGG